MNDFPHNLDDERAVLGSVLLNRDAIIPIATWLKPDRFFAEKHAWIYEAMLALFDKGTPPDYRTVSAELQRRNRLDAAGGITYLVELTDAVPVASHVEYYARQVDTLAGQRDLIIAGGKIAQIGYQSQDIEQARRDARLCLDAATESTAHDDTLVLLSDVVAIRYEEVSKAQQSGEAIQIGIPTGLRDLDEITGGLQKSDLIILAARPSVGKSSLALTIAAQVAEHKRRVDIFSLEMSRQQCLDRLIAMQTGMNLMAVRQMRFQNDSELAVYLDALGWADQLPIAIDDRFATSAQDIRSRILRRQAQIGPPELVIVDYLQLMSANRRIENRVQEVSEISRGLKALARELNVPILALSQLSRAVEGRASHVPMLSDLRESGSIEQDSDIVMFVYREELYDKDTDKKGIAELHIAKHRNGPIGVVPMRFDASTTRFMDLTYRIPDGY